MRMLAGISMISAVIPDPPDPEAVRWVLKDPVQEPVPASRRPGVPAAKSQD